MAGQPTIFPIEIQTIYAQALSGLEKYFNAGHAMLRQFGKAFDEESQDMQRASFRMGRTGGIMSGLIGWNIRRAGKFMADFGMVSAAALGGTVKAAEEFELQMAKVASVVEGNTQEMAALREQAIRTALDAGSAFGATETAQALESLAQAGFSASEASAALAPTLDLAAASFGRLTVEQAAQLAVMASRSLGVQKQMGGLAGFMDKLVVATQKSNLGFEDLRTTFARVGATGITMKNTTVGSILAIAAAGRNANKTGKEVGQSIQGMGIAIAALNKEQGAMGLTKTKMKTGALAQLGLRPQDLVAANGEWKNMVEILALMTRRQQALGMTTKDFGTILNLVFAKGAGSLAVLAQNMSDIKLDDGRILSGVDALEALAAQVEAAGGDKINQANIAAQKFLETWAGVKKQFTNIWVTFQVVLGETLLPMLTKLLQTTNQILSSVVRWTKENALFRIGLIALTASLGITLVSFGWFLFFLGTATIFVAMLTAGLALYTQVVAEATAITGTLSAALTWLQATAWPLAVAAFPYLLAVLAVLIPLMAFGAGVILAWQLNLGGLGDKVSASIGDIANAFKVLGAFLRGESVSEAMGDRLFKQSPMLGRFVIMVMNLSYRIGQLWEGIKEGLLPQLEKVGPQAETVFINFKRAVGILAKFLGLSTDTGPSQIWRTIGIAIGQAVAALMQLGWWIAYTMSIMSNVVAVVNGAIGMMVKFVVVALSWLTKTLDVIPRMIIAALTDGFSGMKDVVKEHLRPVAALLPFSEPKDSSSPLSGLGASGASILRNIALGMLAYSSPFGSMVASALSHALTPGPGSAPGLTSVLTAPPVLPTGTAGGQASGASITVTIGELVFQAAEMTPAEAEKFAKVIADSIALELQRQMTAEAV